MKEASFVYHDKRSFFLHFGQKPAKTTQNMDKSGFGAALRLLRSPIFCVPGPDQADKVLRFETRCLDQSFAIFYVAEGELSRTLSADER